MCFRSFHTRSIFLEFVHPIMGWLHWTQPMIGWTQSRRIDWVWIGLMGHIMYSWQLYWFLYIFFWNPKIWYFHVYHLIRFAMRIVNLLLERRSVLVCTSMYMYVLIVNKGACIWKLSFFYCKPCKAFALLQSSAGPYIVWSNSPL